MATPSLAPGLSDSDLSFSRDLCARVLKEFSERIVGQAHLVDRLLLALIADGHVLLEGLPGLAKTSAIKTLGELSHLQFKRIQFTPDLLPADVVGTQVFNPRSGEFYIKKGPIFTQLLLADEINRAPAKVQSALLEAMQERQVTLGDNTFPLEAPFLVLATQNPIEQEGTYPLPEAQVDRFMLKVTVTYPSPNDEITIVERHSHTQPARVHVMSAEDILRMRRLAQDIHVAPEIRRYIVSLVNATRTPGSAGLPSLQNLIQVGASPRASIDLDRAARAHALMRGRGYVVPQDIKDVAHDVLRHRVVVSFEAEADRITSDAILEKILAHVPVP